MKRILTAAACLSLFAVTPAIAGGYKDKSATASMSKDIVDIAAGNKDFSTLVTAVTAADLAGALKSDGPFTVFAPTNAAFDALPEGALAGLLEPEAKPQLQSVLKYHVVASKVLAGDIPAGKTAVTTLSGDTLTVEKRDGHVMINGAKVVAADVVADNGVIHVIDTVLLPG